MKFSAAIFKTFFVSLCIVANTAFAYAQTASILPNAKTTFTDQNGKPLTSGTVDFYVPGTTTRKTTWQDSTETTPNANPVVLDAAGRALIWGDGAYRQIVKDRNGNLVWDQITSSIGSGSSSGSTIGDGLPVGTILPNSGIIAPNNYQFAYGQALSRTSYPELFAAITNAVTANCTGGSPILTNISDTSYISVGAVVESICASGSPTVISKTSNSITLSTNATITVSTTTRIFIYGNGDGLTTFNLPDLRGYVISGRCNMGGVDCANLNSTYFSSNSNNTPSGVNAKGGNQSSTLITANLPPYTPTANPINVTSLSGSIPNNAGNYSGYATGGTGHAVTGAGGSGGSDATISSIVSTGTFSGLPQGGTATPYSLLQPTLTLNYIIKVTPDVNLTSSYGVASIGGMTGILSCGSGVVCAANTISFNCAVFSSSTSGCVPASGGGTNTFLRADGIFSAFINPLRVVTAAGSITVTNSDAVVVINKTIGAATIVDLPAFPTAGAIFTIKDGKGDAFTNNITITPSSGTIDGSATFVINVAYGSVNLTYNGTEWNVL